MSPTAGDLLPASVSTALGSAFPGVDATRWRSEPLVTGRGMTATLLRLRLTGEEPCVPSSLVAKLSPADPGLQAQLRAMGFFEREVYFYRNLASVTPVNTPACYFTDVDPASGQALLLLEDLTSARNGETVAGGSVDEVAAVLVALARMHARWWQHDEVADPQWCRLPSMLAPSAVTEVFERSWPSFLSRLSSPLDDEVAVAKAWISSTLPTASTALFETGPRTLIHNDIQADNLFFGQDPHGVTIIDWQLVTYGRCVVDVASAIRGALEPSARRSAEPSLLQHYHQTLAAQGVHRYSFDQCQADYRLATVIAPARLASAVGLHPGLRAHPGAAWDVLFPRLAAHP